MEYTVQKLAKLSGVSSRTLRYYDEIGLLIPERVSSNGYRIYGQKQVDMLQQILFYRELGFSLEEIKGVIHSPNFDSNAALKSHLENLLKQKERIELLINNVRSTISSEKGELTMSNKEKFEGFKDKLIKDNEEKYGHEIRFKYGDEIVNASNSKVKGMSQEQWDYSEALRLEINALLNQVKEYGNILSPEAELLFNKHKEWLCLFWKEGTYSPEAHKNLAEMYISDDRFKKYYDDAAGEGGASLVKEIIYHYCEK